MLAARYLAAAMASVPETHELPRPSDTQRKSWRKLPVANVGPLSISSGETDRRRGRTPSHMDVARRVDLRSPGRSRRQDGAEEGRAGMPRRGSHVRACAWCVGEPSRGIWPLSEPRPEDLIWDERDPGAKIGGNLWISRLIPEVGERAAHYADSKRSRVVGQGRSHRAQTRGPATMLRNQRVASGPAKQARALGLKVGDVIFGRAETRGHWNEVKLQLLFLGREVCVWRSWRRTKTAPRWKAEGESAHWDLSCRPWSVLQKTPTGSQRAARS